MRIFHTVIMFVFLIKDVSLVAWTYILLGGYNVIITWKKKERVAKNMTLITNEKNIWQNNYDKPGIIFCKWNYKIYLSDGGGTVAWPGFQYWWAKHTLEIRLDGTKINEGNNT